MQLLLAIVQDEDANTLCKQLNEQGFRVTRIRTVGAFLARGNVTILVGLEDHQVDKVIALIQNTCKTRRSFINPTPYGTEPVHLAVAAPTTPLEVQIGGATVFTFAVKQFARLTGDKVEPAPGDMQSRTERVTGATPMNLLVAFVQNEDVDQVTRGLLEAGHRVTRINTAGAFLRRGNVTLLVGVEGDKTDDAIARIQANCQVRKEATPLESGMPTYSATIFVLEAARMIRV